MSTKRNPVGWFEIYVQDMTRAKKFYETTFGHQLEELPSPGMEMWAFPGMCDDGDDANAPGAGGSLVKMEGKHTPL